MLLPVIAFRPSHLPSSLRDRSRLSPPFCCLPPWPVGSGSQRTSHELLYVCMLIVLSRRLQVMRVSTSERQDLSFPDGAQLGMLLRTNICQGCLTNEEIAVCIIAYVPILSTNLHVVHTRQSLSLRGWLLPWRTPGSNGGYIWETC